MFFIIVLSIWAAVHLHVGWRVAGLPWIAAHIGGRTVGIAFLLLWASYPAARILAARGLHGIAGPIELLGSLWIGVLFLLFAALIAAEVATLGGWLFARAAPAIRSVATMAGLAMASVAAVQGLRAPVIREHEVPLPGLPAALDGTRLAVLTDTHLGTLIGGGWLAARIQQVESLQPDAILIAGDLVDSDLDGATALQPLLAELRAPLGTWVVLGNHDVYAGVGRVLGFAEGAGLHVLRNRHAELAPGLIVAGIDDPATLRRRAGLNADNRLDDALAGIPTSAATILLAHTPDSHTAADAAAAGVGLMLSGHTHGGQIWPFSYLVARRYPLLAGRYDVGAMAVLVCRGTGTWGPRMRLWRPGEILLVTLRSPKAAR